eukprot:363756-Chlamydomonas_euryale.AAC.7
MGFTTPKSLASFDYSCPLPRPRPHLPRLSIILVSLSIHACVQIRRPSPSLNCTLLSHRHVWNSLNSNSCTSDCSSCPPAPARLPPTRPSHTVPALTRSFAYGSSSGSSSDEDNDDDVSGADAFATSPQRRGAVSSAAFVDSLRADAAAKMQRLVSDCEGPFQGRLLGSVLANELAKVRARVLR